MNADAAHCRLRMAHPLDRPFTHAEARQWGITSRELSHLVRRGELIQPFRGVYHADRVEDDLALRIGCLLLVMPADAVITDRTAAWLHGATMVLAPGAHLDVPRVSLYRQPGYRLRNKLVKSGERTFASHDLMSVGGIRVTTPLRTACDLGRLLHRDQAFAAMDALMRVGGFSNLRLQIELERFKGARGVRQARSLAPLADPRAESQPESILRLRWLDLTTLPRPVPQLEVVRRGGRGSFWLDLAEPDLRYAAEYDGVQWHEDERQKQKDRARRREICDEHGFIIDVLGASDLFGPHANPWGILQDGIARAERRRR
ncbi:type IV toxin-antitoxin system AbiEi family antitoxin domain-containing protein [Nocardioides daedukensis]|uniref:type IV toxin-antitoxin system AbiEi family antitoxin domain-containing protein n=1 Tax=Nocardioides daedukensis TaxID=634462 RepID=UPI0031B5FF99